MAKKSENRDLAEAARLMRTSKDKIERQMAASKMGRVGGKHSHDNDPARLKLLKPDPKDNV